MMPSGGVSAANLGAWLAAGAVAVSAGGELCPVEWASEGRFDEIAARAREFIAAFDRQRSAVRRSVARSCRR